MVRAKRGMDYSAKTSKIHTWFAFVCGASGSLCLCQRTSLEVMHSNELDDKYDPEHLATGKQGSHVPCFVCEVVAKNAECS